MNYTNKTARSLGLPLVNLAPTVNYVDRTDDHPVVKNGKAQKKMGPNDRVMMNLTSTDNEEEIFTRFYQSIPRIDYRVKNSHPLVRAKDGAYVRLGVQTMKQEVNPLTGERFDHVGIVELSIRGDYSEIITDGDWTEIISRLISSLPWAIAQSAGQNDPRLVLGVNSLLKGAVQLRPDMAE